MSSKIENYLGFPSGLSGGDLSRRAVIQARRLVLFCRPQRFLRVGYEVDRDRVRAFAGDIDTDLIESRLESLSLIAAADQRGGPVAALDIGERFHWLSNISNTIIQPGEVHSGLTVDAGATFDRLFAHLVAPVQPAP